MKIIILSLILNSVSAVFALTHGYIAWAVWFELFTILSAVVLINAIFARYSKKARPRITYLKSCALALYSFLGSLSLIAFWAMIAWRAWHAM
jgi:hypothetical protein